MDCTVTTPPVSNALPESLTVLKSALRIEHTADDTYLTELLVAAAEQVGERCGRQVLTCTRRLNVQSWWSGSLDIPFPNLQSVTSITYVDADNATQTLSASNYTVFTSGTYGRIVLDDGLAPQLGDDPRPISINFVCGYGITPATVPSGLRLAIRELVRCWYEEKTPRGSFPEHVDALLDNYRLVRFWNEI